MLAGVVTGIVGGLVGAVQGIAQLIGGLFSFGRRDTAAVDQARADGERLIVENMSSSLEYLDEIQRVGGAFADWPRYYMNLGERNPHPLPLGSAEPPYYGAFPLAQGTIWHPPDKPLTHSSGHVYNGSVDWHRLARGAGTLELAESGLWMIWFQAALLQGPGYTSMPADVWCYVTDNEEWVPVGSPPGSGTIRAYSRLSDTPGEGGFWLDLNVSRIHTFGRAGQYLGDRDSTQGGGNTVSGYMMAYLDSPGWFLHMACSGHQHFGGPASTFMFAQKVNSATLRGDIDQAKADLAAALPGTPVNKLLNEDVIAAMVAEAEAIDVLSQEPQG